LTSQPINNGPLAFQLNSSGLSTMGNCQVLQPVNDGYNPLNDVDISSATLIKGTKIYEEVHVLSGRCPQCKTIYYADHETSAPIDKNSGDDNGTKVYLNNAKYLKVGQSVWVNRVFSGGVINGIYHFHASSSAFAEFWNNTFWSSQTTQSRKIS